MVEVFKTTVEDYDVAARLIAKLEGTFSDYAVNFDLEDCDRILRVQCENGVDPGFIIAMIRSNGFDAEVLEDEMDHTLKA